MEHYWCGGTVNEKKGRYGVYYECDKCHTTISKVFMNNEFQEGEIVSLFEGDTVSGEFTSRKGKTFKAGVELVNRTGEKKQSLTFLEQDDNEYNDYYMRNI